MIARHRLGWLIASAAVCATVALLHQPRPAIGAAATTVAVAIGGWRRLALLACLVAAFGLIAASPPQRHTRGHAAPGSVR